MDIHFITYFIYTLDTFQEEQEDKKSLKIPKE